MTTTNRSRINPAVITSLHERNEHLKSEHRKNKAVCDFLKWNNYSGRSLVQYSFNLLAYFAKEKEASQGAFFIAEDTQGISKLRFLTGFAAPGSEYRNDILDFGEGFPGQVAKDQKLMNISDIPGGYISIKCARGKSEPVSLLIFPVLYAQKTLAVIELAASRKFTRDDEKFFEEISESIAEEIFKCCTY